MAQKKQPKASVIKRLRARLKKKPKLKQVKKRMAYGKRFRRPRFRSPFRRRSRSYSGGGFSRRAPILGFKIPSMFIWLALIGGGLFFGKDFIKPMLDKLKHKA